MVNLSSLCKTVFKFIRRMIFWFVLVLLFCGLELVCLGSIGLGISEFDQLYKGSVASGVGLKLC